MWLSDIIYRKYGLNGYNNPTDFFAGICNKLPERKAGISRIYFTGIPEHGNMGDQAIAYAMNRFAEAFADKYEVLTFTMSGFLDCLIPIKKDCRREDIFFLIGGGNMGIEYFGNEEVRRLIIEIFPANRIIIFPQTMDYGKTDEGRRQLCKAQNIYGRHRNLHIFAREKVSYDMMRDCFRSNHVYLVPDIVYSLEFDKKYKRSYILKCLRNDREASLKQGDVERIDRTLAQYGSIRVTDTVLSYVPVITSEEIRRKLVYRKLTEFAEAELVVTDRLHGMIFSVITNTPCIVIGNYNHKLISSYRTWLEGFKDVFFMQDINGFEQLVKNAGKCDGYSQELKVLRTEYDSIKMLL